MVVVAVGIAVGCPIEIGIKFDGRQAPMTNNTKTAKTIRFIVDASGVRLTDYLHELGHHIAQHPLR